MSDDETVRFHNGDTLDSIPVVRPTVPLPPGLRRLPPDPEVFPQRPPQGLAVMGWVVAGSLVIGGLVGLSVAASDDDPPAATPTGSAQPTVVITETPSPAPTETVSVWKEPSREPEPEPETAWEDVMVYSAPATGGDPSTDYCFSYVYDPTSSTIQAALLSNAADYECDDYLFSTHPDDFEGVWEEYPPDCSETPGGRTARVSFMPGTDYSNTVLYTCLLGNT